jgi:hypothetical protein
VSIFTAQAEVKDKTPMKRFQAAQDYLKACRDRYDRARSDLIMAERWAQDAGNEYMREYFPPNRK